MKLSGVSVRVEPRNMVNGLVPRTLMRDPTQKQLLQRALQGAIPDMEYTDPKHGRKKIVEFKVINQNSTQVHASPDKEPAEHA